MDSFGELSGKKFLSKDDVETPLTVTIKGFTFDNVGNSDGGTDKVGVMHVEESERGVILKATNANTLKELFGTPNQAVGKKVELYNDHSVMFGGKKIGGLRIRAAGAATGKAPF